jgi:hypothetical protein
VTYGPGSARPRPGLAESDESKNIRYSLLIIIVKNKILNN